MGLGGLGALRLVVPALAAAVVLLALAVRALSGSGGARGPLWVAFVVVAAAATSGVRGFTRLGPGEAVVVQSWGRYVGTLRRPGLWWTGPWTRRRHLSLRVQVEETAVLKVNDVDGLPIEVAAAVTWQIVDTARAAFAVEDPHAFLRQQAEMALRRVTSLCRYEPKGPGAPSLCANADDAADELTHEIARRTEQAGIAVLECQLVRVAYAPEIAQAMLRRQQASAIIAARQQIVDGAVGMVELALDRLEEKHVVDLDEERKATMVSNLLVVLCSDHPTQPMVNTGSLYL
ncbi:MAG TPA: SPFH domain-containing protein [Acidimicrobiales bacterium]|nr:SPFH domain-containing protein [Acidimicrobiales bacterium]